MTYTVKEIAERMGMTEHAVRFYTDRELFPCKRDKNNHRIFDEESINWLTGIQCLKKCGVSISDIKIYTDLCQKGDATLEERYAFMLKQQQIARDRLEEARQLVDYMDRKVAHYKEILSGQRPDDTNPAMKEPSA